MVAFVVIYSFLYSGEFNAVNMNYTSLIVGGLTAFVILWWFWIENKKQTLLGCEKLDTSHHGARPDSVDVPKKQG